MAERFLYRLAIIVVFCVFAMPGCWLGEQLAAAQAATPATGPVALLPDAIDYGRSYFNSKAPWNSPRFWVESRLQITDPATKTVRTYYQCGSCKSERTIPPRDLFPDDNYDFLPVFGDVDCVIFRHRARADEGYRGVAPVAGAWGGMVPLLRRFKGRVLSTSKEISDAMTAGLPLVAQTEIRDEKTGRTAVIECPVKTINWFRTTGQWQIDTGPVLLPDLSVPPEQWSQNLRLAFVAFNAWDWAEFIAEKLTPVVAGGKEVAKVYHYSAPAQTKARNALLAQDVDLK
jgi:hypothetical protein